MIKIARANQRRLYKSESGTIRSCLSRLLGSPESLEPLLSVNERTIGAKAEGEQESSSREEILLAFLSNDLQVSSDSVGGVCADPDSVVYSTLSASDEKLIYRNPSGKSTSFLEIIFETEREVSGTIIEKSPVDYTRKRSLFSLAGGRNAKEEVLPLNADCSFYVAYLRKNENLIFETVVNRQSYCLILEGAVRVGNERLLNRDAALLSEVNSLEINAHKRSTFILIDLPNRAFVENEMDEQK